jgi:L-asparaginase/Glu-tRNA(Gln) amidotransferase subunit D
MTEKEAVEKARLLCKNISAKLYNDEWEELTKVIAKELEDTFFEGVCKGFETDCWR